MPNWTQNTLVISVPADNADTLIDAITGPADWPYPLDGLNSFEHPKIELSKHQKLRLENDREALVAEFYAHHANTDWPDWMKPGPSDLLCFLVDPDYRSKEFPVVDFSVAKLRPWRDKEEFSTFFPETDANAPVWTGTSETARVIDTRQHFLGTKWPPGDITRDIEPNGDKITIRITYSTPWSPISNLADLISPILDTHGAKACLTWVEEQGYCGWEHIDPTREIEASDEYDAGRFVRVIVEYPGTENEEEFHEFDHDAFDAVVCDRIDDPDLQ